MPQDSYSENQGRLILERQWASREQVSYAWQALAASPHLDLCAVLIQMGQLDRAQAMELRSNLGQATEQTVLGQSTPALSPQSSAPTLPPGPISESRILGQLPGNQSSQERVAHLSQSSSGEFNISIPGYEVVKEIGRGGMGAVFLVNQEGSQTPCVAKVMLNADMGEEAYIRFKREAQALARLKHENIVAIKTFGEINGYPYFIMEHIVGRELKEHIEENLKSSGSAPPVEEVLELLIPVARALTYAHEKGIVHRDLKPANILIESKTKRPIILDYGLAKSDQKDLSESLSNGEHLTKTGQALGTPAYMAPEQLDLSSQSGAQPANDVWGFAATLFFALLGQPPYVGPTPVNIYSQLLKYSPPILSDLNPNLPRWLEQLCELCFQRDMAQRPTMAAVLEALEKQDSSGLNLRLTKAAKRARTQKAALILAVFLMFIALSAFAYDSWKPVEKDLDIQFVTDIPKQSTSPLLKFSLKTNFEPNLTTVSATLGSKDSDEIKQKISLKPDNGVFQGEFSEIGNGTYTVRVLVRLKNEEAKSEVLEKTILVDQTPPSFNHISVTTTGLLTAELSEDGCVVKWNQKNIKVEKRRFTIQLDPLTLNNREQLVVTDRVGHQLTLKQRPYHVVRMGGALTLAKAVNRAQSGDVVFIHPGRYSSQVTVDKSIALIGLIKTKEQDAILGVTNLPSTSLWPLLEGFKKPALRIRLKEKGQVVIRGLSFNQKNFVGDISEKMAEDSMTQKQLDHQRTKEQNKEKEQIAAGLLDVKKSEDEAFQADSRCQQTAIMIEEGVLEMDHCVVQSEAFVQLLCGPRRTWKLAAPGLIARDSVFLRGSVLGTVILGSSAQMERCIFIEKRSPSGDYTRRKAERPFIFKYPALFGVWNRGEATIKNCQFLNSLDRSVFAGQKKGYFPKVISQLTLEDSLISGAKTDGLYMGWTVQARVKNCIFEKAIENGVYLNGAKVTLSMDNSRVRHCGFGKPGKNNRVPGLFVNGSVLNSRIRDCQIEDCGGAGLGLYGSGRFTVEKSSFHRNGAGIFMGGAFSGTLEVSESEIFDNEIAGIHMKQASPAATASFRKSRVRSRMGVPLLCFNSRVSTLLGHTVIFPSMAQLILTDATVIEDRPQGIWFWPWRWVDEPR